MENTGEALARIVKQVTEVNGIVGDMALSAREQSTALQEVNVAINHMDQVTQQNAAMVEESTAATQSLAHETSGLAALVAQFETSRPTLAPAPNRGFSRPRPKLLPGRKGTSDAVATARQPEAPDWEDF